jgi:hypothetical protein
MTGRAVGVRLWSVSGTTSLTIPLAHLTSDGVVDSQWGNRERVLSLTFRSIFTDSATAVYTYTT